MDGNEQPHSAQAFGPLRDFWWNRDHLELCARGFGFASARSVLDVGSGVGHWGRVLAAVLPPDAKVVGVDPEQRWVDEAGRLAAEAGMGDRFEYRLGSVEELPFEDGAFDLVTCQTLLMHVADPRAAIREMTRVARPGGVVLAAEPNNRGIFLMDTSLSADATVAERIDLVQFQLTCEQGKVALGEGNNSIGELVPRYFADEGLEQVQVRFSDKAWLMLPPYDDPESRTLTQAYADDVGKGPWGSTRDETLRYYLAGGGRAEDFDATWERRMAESRQAVAAIEAGELSFTGGRIMYMVTGRRPC